MYLIRLLKHGTSIEATNPSFETLLHIACECGDELEVSILLHHGAFLGAQNRDGCTPLMYAVLDWPQPVIAKLLLEKASIADIVHRDKYGCSMLSRSVATLAESEDMIMLLLNTIDFQAARELGTPEGDEFVELSDIVKKTGYDGLLRGVLRSAEGLSDIKLSQRSLINCLQAIAEKVDLGQLDWYDDDIKRKFRKEEVRFRLTRASTIGEEEEDDRRW